ncbi:GNAT family N-acetyltransferase [Geoglobus acetivorans]|uniref:GNAT family N-acetyltransferase n=1 Tax=Geoglobus acetivorans TaxID=565033 RepID=A0ABZ3H4W0_GEOAI|nr:GNAT family N-acetyltransferase [Geoglobus acetivorans]
MVDVLTGYLVREMKDEEVEEIIIAEYEHFGYSVFADLSKTDYSKKVIVCEEDGEIAGFAVLYWDENSFHIGSLIVDDRYRGSGIGKALVDGAKKEAFKRGFRKIYADVSVSSSALDFYMSNGFEIEETIKHYYGISKHAFRLSLTV